MYTKEDKQKIRKQLNESGIKDIKHIFDMIEDVNKGLKSKQDVDTYIKQEMYISINNRKQELRLLDVPKHFSIFGENLIEPKTIQSMRDIMRLPYVTGGALMPDAHFVKDGSVPVGGVVVTDGIIIPDIVSADASCSVMLSVTNIKVSDLGFNESDISFFVDVLNSYSYFGHQTTNVDISKFYFYHKQPSLKTKTGQSTLLKMLQQASSQFGTSGDGNHFANIGVSNVKYEDGIWRETSDNYLSILTHFGSRGLGATLASVFGDEAKSRYAVKTGQGNFGLDIDSDLGYDYYSLLDMAGSFSYDGHIWLHKQLLNAIDERISLGGYTFDTIYSRHNYAWKTSEGIIHRKGATPTELGQYGVIPATMGDKTQIVIGLGNKDSYKSASHGAGRIYSRNVALQNFSDDTKEYVSSKGVTLIGGGADEDPRAYKRIEDVMQEQVTCVDTIGTFTPVVVRMAPPKIYGKK